MRKSILNEMISGKRKKNICCKNVLDRNEVTRTFQQMRKIRHVVCKVENNEKKVFIPVLDNSRVDTTARLERKNPTRSLVSKTQSNLS